MNYSVVIPVYNSEQTLEELFHRLKTVFENFEPPPPSASPPKGEKKQSSFEVIFVDDFSKDGSWGTLKKIKEENPERAKIIRLAKNYGQHNATFCGFAHSRGEFIITMDDDFQNAPEDIAILIDKIKSTDADLVYGMGESQHSFLQKKASDFYKFNSKYVEKGLGKGSSFRILSRALLEKSLLHGQYFIYIDELLFWYTNYIAFAEVPHYKRRVGKSGYTPPKFFQMLTQGTLLYGSWPLKLMVWFGSVFSVLAFAIGVLYVVKKLVFGVAIPGFTTLIVAIAFSTGLILLCFGILGHYLVNVHVMLNKKPAYSIKEER